MLILAKLAGILILIWFYLTAKKIAEPAVKWAIIGLVGYWITWWLANKLILFTLAGLLSKSTAMVFIATQIPVVVGVAAAFFVRNKLINDAKKKTSTE